MSIHQQEVEIPAQPELQTPRYRGVCFRATVGFDRTAYLLFRDLGEYDQRLPALEHRQPATLPEPNVGSLEHLFDLHSLGGTSGGHG